jgi:hypothetical protein
MASLADSKLESSFQDQLSTVTTTFALEHSIPLTSAMTIEQECKRWLWVTWLHSMEQKHFPNSDQFPPRLVISKELEWIDKYWHHFFSKHPVVYQEFCLKHFSFTIEHVEENHAAVPPMSRENLKLQLNYLYDRIGPQKLKLWYVEIQSLMQSSSG